MCRASPPRPCPTRDLRRSDGRAVGNEGRILEAERTLAGNANDLNVLNQFGQLQLDKGSYNRAEEAFSRLRQLASDRRDPAWQIAAASKLAETYRAQGRLTDAEAGYRSALELTERIHGANDPRLSPVLNSLADVYKSSAVSMLRSHYCS